MVKGPTAARRLVRTAVQSQPGYPCGNSWTDISGNLPDEPADDVVLVYRKVIVATDLGVFIAPDGGHSWSRLGRGLPNVDTWALGVSPSLTYVVAATHGRGQWKLPIP